MTSEKSHTPEILFVMTIDTEEEWDWNKSVPPKTYSVNNTQSVPKFQEFCQNFGIRPTYFIDYAIASDPSSVKCFRKYAARGECELGAHLHSWVNPPIEEELHEKNTHAINLPTELVKQKLKQLTEKFEHEFSMRPLSFRSGRWGINGQLLRLLIENGYETDSSVLPFYADSTFSYDGAPDTPYWPDLTHCIREGKQRHIFELPATSGFNRSNFTLCNTLHKTLSHKPWTTFRSIGILWHLRLLRKLKLSPELTDASNMISLIKACVRRKHRLIHMFFHSSSLLVGGNPYISNENDEKIFYDTIADVIQHITEQYHVKFCTLTEAKQCYLQEENA